MIRPLYRWKTFWFGVLVVMFLAWAWARSTKVIDKHGWSSGGNHWTLVSTGGSFGIIRFSTGAGNLVVPRSAIAFPPAWYSSREELGGSLSVSQHVCAYWFASVAFLVPWSGWLAWKWRRMRSHGARLGPPV